MASRAITQNYFVAPNSQNRFSLPVISINTDEDNLVEYNNGIVLQVRILIHGEPIFLMEQVLQVLQIISVVSAI